LFVPALSHLSFSVATSYWFSPALFHVSGLHRW
jgi:hypothetical protein